MRLSTSQSARPQFYDRNPVTKNGSYINGGDAPHVGTSRMSYTVPAGKKAWIDNIHVRVMRQTAGTTASEAGFIVEYTPNGGAASRIGEAYIYSNTPQDRQQIDLSALGFIAAGDMVRIFTIDGSTGGTVAYVSGMKYTEFDA